MPNVKKGSLFIDFIAQGTRPNQLFLTEAVEKNIGMLNDVLTLVRDHLEIIRPESVYRELTLRARKDKDFIEFLSEFLRLATQGFARSPVKSEVFNPEKHFKNLPENFRKKLLKDMEAGRFNQFLLQGPDETITLNTEEKDGKKIANFLRLKTVHERTDGSRIDFDTALESDGTQRLMHLVPMLKEIWETR